MSGERIAVIRPGALGDAILTLPVLQSLTAAGARVTVVGHPVFRLAVECRLADGFVAFDDARLLPLFADHGKCDLLAGHGTAIAYEAGAVSSPDCLKAGLRTSADRVGSPGFTQSSLEAGGSPLANALRRSGVGRVISWPAKPEPGRHITDHLLGALEGTGIGTTTHQPSLRPQGAWTTAARAWLDERGVGGGFAAIHPGSGGKAKRWPVERFAEVARALPCPTLWLLGPAEEEDAATRAIGEQVGVVADRLPLPSLAGLLALCRAYVGNDSGATHLAAAVGAPTLALFGPTDPAVWAPRGERVTVLGGPQAAGFEGLSVQKVLQKLPARLTT